MVIVPCSCRWGLVLTLAYDQCLRAYDTHTNTVRHCWQNESRCQWTALEVELEFDEVRVTYVCAVYTAFCAHAEHAMYADAPARKCYDCHVSVTCMCSIRCAEVLCSTTLAALRSKLHVCCVVSSAHMYTKHAHYQLWLCAQHTSSVIRACLRMEWSMQGDLIAKVCLRSDSGSCDTSRPSCSHTQCLAGAGMRRHRLAVYL